MRSFVTGRCWFAPTLLALLSPFLAHASDAEGPRIVFDASAAKLPQTAIRAAIEKELGEPGPGERAAPVPSRTRAGSRLAIAVNPDGSLVVRYEDGEGVRERTLPMPSRESDVPVVIGLIAGNLARDQRSSAPEAPGVVRKEPATTEEEEIPAPYRASSKRNHFWVHGEAGVGFGTEGLGGRYGGEAVVWFSDLVGVGLAGGASAQSFFNSGVDDWFIAPELALRVDPAGYGGFVGVAAGLGHQTISRGEFFCFLSACDPPQKTASVGLYTGLGLGLIGHVGWFQLGPVLRVEAMFASEAEVLGTLNLAIGVAP